jgi:hypothetical protein
VYSESGSRRGRFLDDPVRSMYIVTIATIRPAIAKYVLNRKRNGTSSRISRYMVPPAGAGG